MEKREFRGDYSNAMAAFGQKKSPKPGANIRKIEINNEDHTGFYDKLKDRYLWFPLEDIDYTGKLVQQPLSMAVIERARIAWIQPTAYKAVDNSDEAWNREDDETAPLKTFLMTPFAQCMHLYTNFAERGMRVFEHLKDVPPEVVLDIEEAILPEVPDNLIDLGNYLASESVKNIESAEFSPKTEKLAYLTLEEMIQGTNTAVEYCRNLIDASAAEILTRRNKGWGKPNLDDKDKYAHIMLKRKIPLEETLEGRGDSGEKMIEKLAAAIMGKQAPTSEADESEVVKELKAQLDAMEQRFNKLLAMAEKSAGAPIVEDDATPIIHEAEEAAEEAVQNSRTLKARLDSSRKNRNQR